MRLFKHIGPGGGVGGEQSPGGAVTPAQPGGFGRVKLAGWAGSALGRVGRAASEPSGPPGPSGP